MGKRIVDMKFAMKKGGADRAKKAMQNKGFTVKIEKAPKYLSQNPKKSMRANFVIVGKKRSK